MPERVFTGGHQQGYDIPKGHDPYSRTDPEMVTDPLLKLIKSHTPSPVKKTIQIHKCLGGHDTVPRKFGKKNHFGDHMGGEEQYGIFFASHLLCLFNVFFVYDVS